MATERGWVVEFGGFLLDEHERTLTRAGRRLHLRPREFDLLVRLVADAGHLISKNDLLRDVWKDTFVQENNLTVAISGVRRVLGDHARRTPYIQTVHGFGYRFSTSIERRPASS